MRQIGLDLIYRAHERLTLSGEGPVNLDFREDGEKAPVWEESQDVEMQWRGMGGGALKGRDLLSLLSAFDLCWIGLSLMSWF